MSQLVNKIISLWCIDEIVVLLFALFGLYAVLVVDDCESGCSFTTARVLHERLAERLEWKHARTFVPKGNKRLMCFVDDINIAQVMKAHRAIVVECKDMRQFSYEDRFQQCKLIYSRNKKNLW